MKNFILSLLTLLFLQAARADIEANTTIATVNNPNLPAIFVTSGIKVVTRAGLLAVSVSGNSSSIDAIPLVFLSYGNRSFIAMTPNHPVLTARGTFKKASQLIPGQDFVVNASGEPVQILGMTLRKDRYQRNRMITSPTGASSTTVNMHTILVNGIWLGDYMVESACNTGAARTFCEY